MTRFLVTFLALSSAGLAVLLWLPPSRLFTAAMVLGYLPTCALLAAFPVVSALRDLRQTLNQQVESLHACQAQRQELADKAAARNRGLACLSHELRTPLTSIIGYSRMILNPSHGMLSPAQAEAVQTIEANSQSLLKLVNNLLDLSKIEAGMLEMSTGPVVVGDCLENAYMVVKPLVEQKKLEFCVQLPPQPLVVQGSFGRLSQVFINVLGNAVKFTDQGTIGVEARQRGDNAEVAVWDTGIGIEPQRLPHVFDEFQQGDASLWRKYGGTGLGLAISRRLLQLQGGDMVVEGRSEGGTRVTITIPVVSKSKPV